jgi:hypothetical protein
MSLEEAILDKVRRLPEAKQEDTLVEMLSRVGKPVKLAIG